MEIALVPNAPAWTHPYTSKHHGPYFTVTLPAGGPHGASVGIVYRDASGYLIFSLLPSANGHECLTHFICSSPPKILYISTDGGVRAVSIHKIRRFNPPIRLSIPAQVHPPSSRLRAGSFAISADERWLADWHTPGRVLVWNVVPEAPTLHSRFTFSDSSESSRPDPEFLLAMTFDHSDDPIRSLCHLVGVSNRGAVWRWDVETGAPVHGPWKLPAHASELSSGTASIAFSRSGLRMAWICPDYRAPESVRGPSRVRVFDLSKSRRTGGRRARSVLLEGHDGPVNAFAVTPRGDYIATASADGTVRLWRTEDGQCLRTFTEHEAAAVTHVVISDDGSILASGAEDGTVCVRKMEEILLGVNESK